MLLAIDAEENAHLLYELKALHGAQGFGEHYHFFEVSANWGCPCCFRTKRGIGRLDKNGNLLCSLHEHHDHYGDAVSDALRRDMQQLLRSGDTTVVQQFMAVEESFRRFPPQLICSDCNIAEGAGKRASGADAGFSFSPSEIANFIEIADHQPHRIMTEKAARTYEAVKPSLALLSERARETLRSMRNPDSFEHIGFAAWRVLQGARKNMNGAKPNG
jgi:hypothetical protein